MSERSDIFLRQLGGSMVGLCCAGLTIGKAVITIFFPQLRGAPMPVGLLAVLVPILLLGATGVLLWLTGAIVTKLSSARPTAPDFALGLAVIALVVGLVLVAIRESWF